VLVGVAELVVPVIEIDGLCTFIFIFFLTSSQAILELLG